MRERLIVLREQRHRLVVLAAGERESLGALVDRSYVLDRWMQLANRFAAEVRKHPGWVLAAVAVLVALRPKRALSWAVKGWSLYQLYRRGSSLWARMSPVVAAFLKTS
jgi:hypothetical protein